MEIRIPMIRPTDKGPGSLRSHIGNSWVAKNLAKEFMEKQRVWKQRVNGYEREYPNLSEDFDEPETMYSIYCHRGVRNLFAIPDNCYAVDLVISDSPKDNSYAMRLAGQIQGCFELHHSGEWCEALEDELGSLIEDELEKAKVISNNCYNRSERLFFCRVEY